MIPKNEIQGMSRDELIRTVRQLSFDNDLLREEVMDMHNEHMLTLTEFRLKLDEYEELTDMLTEQVDELGKELLKQIGKTIKEQENGL